MEVPFENREKELNQLLSQRVVKPTGTFEDQVWHLTGTDLSMMWNNLYPALNAESLTPGDQDFRVYRMENFAASYSLPRKDVALWKNNQHTPLVTEALRHFILTGQVYFTDLSILYTVPRMFHVFKHKLPGIKTLIFLDGDNIGLTDQNWMYTALPLLRVLESSPSLWAIMVFRHGVLPGYLSSYFYPGDLPGRPENQSLDVVWSSTYGKDAADHCITSLSSSAHVFAHSVADRPQKVEFSLVGNDRFSTEWTYLFNDRPINIYRPREKSAWFLHFLKDHPVPKVMFQGEWIPFWNRFKQYLYNTPHDQLVDLPEKYLQYNPTDRNLMYTLIGKRALSNFEIRARQPELYQWFKQNVANSPNGYIIVSNLISSIPEDMIIDIRIESIYLVYSWLDFWTHTHIASAFGLTIETPTGLLSAEEDVPVSLTPIINYSNSSSKITTPTGGKDGQTMGSSLPKLSFNSIIPMGMNFGPINTQPSLPAAPITGSRAGSSNKLSYILRWQ